VNDIHTMFPRGAYAEHHTSLAEHVLVKLFDLIKDQWNHKIQEAAAHRILELIHAGNTDHDSLVFEVLRWLAWIGHIPADD
jgi:hypothetical protein